MNPIQLSSDMEYDEDMVLLMCARLIKGKMALPEQHSPSRYLKKALKLRLLAKSDFIGLFALAGGLRVKRFRKMLRRRADLFDLTSKRLQR